VVLSYNVKRERLMNNYPQYNPEDEGPQPKFDRRIRFFKELLQTGLMVLIIYTLLNLVIPRYLVEGSSMEPNFHNGQRLFVSRMDYMFGEPERGHVVVFRNPKDPEGEDLIKRIIGLPGETVHVEGGQVFINGAPIEEGYVKEQLTRTDEREWALGPDEFFVMGDNRNNSNDSFDFGPIQREAIVGRALVSYWPPKWWGVVPGQDYFASPQPTP
jgi:signal peptidase I